MAVVKERQRQRGESWCIPRRTVPSLQQSEQKGSRKHWSQGIKPHLRPRWTPAWLLCWLWNPGPCWRWRSCAPASCLSLAWPSVRLIKREENENETQLSRSQSHPHFPSSKMFLKWATHDLSLRCLELSPRNQREVESILIPREKPACIHSKVIALFLKYF